MGNSPNHIKFSLKATGQLQSPALTWLSNEPRLVSQWPLQGEKLRQVNLLVDEQLEKGHLVPTDSPWNFSIFTIQKSSGKWRLLQDLRELNKIIEPMGALQPGLPTMIPSEWPIIIIDIKDCFFNIALHPKDSRRFAFTVPSINAAEPSQHYHWTILPQGMRNSPSVCQRVIAEVLPSIRWQFPQTILYHYIDDILLAAESKEQLAQLHRTVKATLSRHGLEVAPEKEQMTMPWKYLGYHINNTTTGGPLVV
ncbi:PREDICTED: endogenous retrovirus group K member 25 Pol protein-like [Lepidothrix coronata]|uniref:ribonuclease H n=1 Tax=Lepidothrix coronata TaxID=321398 RepID=A0A6J0HUZ3_9PASS|nr:PREDICTED: endogenous retrovirus group K member 25 Pol protein-like [Lepidothrix coronata]